MNIEKLFDGIAGRYDLFNRISSFGLDKSWREKLALSLDSQKNLKILDVAVGTGDILVTLLKRGFDISSSVGIDPSAEMLEIAQKKLLAHKIELKQAKAEEIPFGDNNFDAVTCAFGVRNFSDVNAGLREMFRVLKPAGKLLILEFSLPPNALIRFLYLVYLNFYIPILGKLITGDFAAYKYLSRTVQSFPSGEKFCSQIQKVGFTNVKANPLTFGIVTIYSANKPAI
jgi:demethylmenaquinone methyltransferase/2-methoxy-6-polyprenyl-1,4-benzoquinol methylase